MRGKFFTDVDCLSEMPEAFLGEENLSFTTVYFNSLITLFGLGDGKMPF